METKYYVMGLLFNPEKTQVCLLKKTKRFPGLLNGPGGSLEESDDSPKAAMIREFKEETNADVTDWEQFGILEGPDWLVFLYKSFGNYEVKTTTAEEVNWYEISDLDYTKTISNLEFLIPMALNKDNPRGTIQYKE